MIRVAAPALPPEQVLRRLWRGARPFLLDGAIDVDGLGRHSVAGCDPDDRVVWRPGDGGDPFTILDAAQRRWTGGAAAAADGPIAVGLLSYDLGTHVVPRPRAHAGFAVAAPDRLPLLDFARYPAVWRLDRESGRAELLADDAGAAARLLERLGASPPPLAPLGVGAADLRWEIDAPSYRARVRRVLDYLRAGDVYQVNLSHALRAPLDRHRALTLYLRLRAVAPAPLGACLGLDDGVVLGNSPELFLRFSPEAVETRPIKGTRARGRDAAEDARLGDELERSDKDHAEHVMIVDLERSDLGRVAVTGSVEVHAPRRRVALPTVHHLVSTVRARPRPDASLADLLRATFPGGSITGAPKLRAMEIIAELEGQGRGAYCGALGWLGPGGRGRSALSIRTAVVADGELRLQVGGGIVADSTAPGELAETRVKAAAFLRAMG